MAISIPPVKFERRVKCTGQSKHAERNMRIARRYYVGL